ncbi:hypothetical protein BDY24DRAFT_384352 [Mrakia frigida]|uniref:succinate:quinone oxidoreductase subunit C n=1 Tax=Mrakia frigida TaxID=29902 RepID=UPI003FCC1142
MFAVSLVGRSTFTTGLVRSRLPAFSAVAFRTLITTPPRPSSSSTVPSPPVKHLTVPQNTTFLNTQRAKRPSSPHFTIYQPQITWLASIAHRVTGVGLSVVMYAGAITFLFHPSFSYLDSAHLVEFFGQLPVWFKTTTKFVFCWPFVFHCFNGVRHLLWDVGLLLSVKEVTWGGWAVVGSSFLTSALMVAFL